jgi:tetratricopeptide (TPR) repeat protein
MRTPTSTRLSLFIVCLVWCCLWSGVGEASAQVVPEGGGLPELGDGPVPVPAVDRMAALPPGVKEGVDHYRAGRYGEAVTALEPAIARGTAPASVHATYVLCLLYEKRAGAALLAAESALDRFDAHPGLLVLSGKAHLQLGEPSAALTAYTSARQAVDAGAAWPEGFDARAFRSEIDQIHLILAGRAAQAGRLDEARTYLEHVPDTSDAAAQADAIRAYVALQRGNADRAATLTREALASTPRDESLLRVRIQALATLERYEDLLPAYETLYELVPGDVDVGIGYGQTLLLNQQAMKARALFAKLLEEFPEDRRIYDVLVEVYRRSLNFDAAAEIRRKQQAVFPEDASLAWDRAALLEKSGQRARARAVYDSLAATASDPVRAALASARTFELADSLAAAADAYRQVADRFPNDPDALQALGDVLIRRAETLTEPASTERWKEALDVHRRLAGRTSGPRRARAWVRAGRSLEALAQPDSARAAYRRALRADPENPRAHYRTAVLHTGNVEATGDGTAFAHAETALRLVLRDAEQMQSQMLSRLEQDGMPDADDQDVYQQAASTSNLAADVFSFFGRRFPMDHTEPVIQDVLDTYNASGRLLYLAGRYYEAHGRTDTATQFYQRATRKAPDLRDAHLALGRRHADAGRLPQAILAYERALASDESHPAAYRALVDLYRDTGRLDVLVRRWQSRLRGMPDNRVLREHLVDALHRLGRHDAARQTARGEPTR